MILLSESRTQAKNHRNKTKEDNLYCNIQIYTIIYIEKYNEDTATVHAPDNTKTTYRKQRLSDIQGEIETH